MGENLCKNEKEFEIYFLSKYSSTIEISVLAIYTEVLKIIKYACNFYNEILTLWILFQKTHIHIPLEVVFR